MLSFSEVWDAASLLNESTDSPEERAIRTGLNIREDFWDDFIRLCNNPEDLSILLGISPIKIASWGSAVKKHLHNVSHANTHSHQHKKTKILNTGGL